MSVSDWELVPVGELARRERYEASKCENRGHDIGVGWRINRDGNRRLQGWCFTCRNDGVGIKKDRPKSEWPEFDDAPVVRDNRPPCHEDRIGGSCSPLWVPSRRHGLWYRACEPCFSIVATDEAWTAPSVSEISFGIYEDLDTIENVVRGAGPGWLVRLILDAVCGRCGATAGTLHRHHWAPRALFVDADDWPTSTLCPPCHSRWHSTVTPGMRRSGLVKLREKFQLGDSF